MRQNCLDTLLKFYHFRDPVHSHISIPEEGLLSDLIDTREFQRLRYIRHLGVTYLTYPGGADFWLVMVPPGDLGHV